MMTNYRPVRRFWNWYHRTFHPDRCALCGERIEGTRQAVSIYTDDMELIEELFCSRPHLDSWVADYRRSA